mmetsp:Transcript_86444/g.240598  ORF Transcript_86444/g.240598 Transcript_86444/m.240598 type:complete len:260 (+) Transcript_86444:182-961(+)
MCRGGSCQCASHDARDGRQSSTPRVGALAAHEVRCKARELVEVQAAVDVCVGLLEAVEQGLGGGEARVSRAPMTGDGVHHLRPRDAAVAVRVHIPGDDPRHLRDSELVEEERGIVQLRGAQDPVAVDVHLGEHLVHLLRERGVDGIEDERIPTPTAEGRTADIVELHPVDGEVRVTVEPLVHRPGLLDHHTDPILWHPAAMPGHKPSLADDEDAVVHLAVVQDAVLVHVADIVEVPQGLVHVLPVPYVLLAIRIHPITG